jgi:hypothetical protein
MTIIKRNYLEFRWADRYDENAQPWRKSWAKEAHDDQAFELGASERLVTARRKRLIVALMRHGVEVLEMRYSADHRIRQQQQGDRAPFQPPWAADQHRHPKVFYLLGALGTRPQTVRSTPITILCGLCNGPHYL